MDSKEISATIKLAENYFQAQNYPLAKNILEKILVIDPNHADAHEFLGYIYGNEGNNELSHMHLLKASEQINCSADALYYLGSSFLSKTEYKKAEECLIRCLKVGGDFFEALHDLGTACAHLNKNDDALFYYRKALNYKTNSYQLYFNIARVLDDLKKFDEAIIWYEKSLQINSNFSKAWLNKGISLNHLKRYEEAIFHYDKSLEINKEYVEAWVNKGATLNQLKKFNQALDCYNMAIGLNPSYAQAWTNKGVTLNNLGNPYEALDHHKNAIKLQPNLSEAWSNAGITFNDLKLFDEAITHYDTAIRLSPSMPNAHWNKSLTLLTLGRFDEGWDLYEYRWKKIDAENYKHSNIPELKSTKNLLNKTVLVWCEQGFGDSLHFYRYISELQKTGAIVTFEVQKSLQKLMQANLSCNVIHKTSEENIYDFQIPLLSLPKLFGTRLETIPGIKPVITVATEDIKKWIDKLNLSKSRVNIGLAISGNTNQQTNAQRSIPLEKIQPLCKHGNIFLIQNYLLSDDQKYLEEHPEINYLGNYLSDFTDTAEIVGCMDIIISTCTSLVHLAGSMNKKTFLMSRWAPDWRWLLDRDDSPWYPSVKIFRQQSIGNWDSVINQIEVDLIKNQLQSSEPKN